MSAIEDRDGVGLGATDLNAGAIGLGGALMQSIAQISPTLGIFYTIAFTTGQAGAAAPLTYLAAFIICLILTVPMAGLARHLPSAGGLYTYVARGLGPKAGFVTGWLYGVSVAIVPAALAAFTGAIIHDELSSKYGFDVPWGIYALVILGICFASAFRGIVISIRFLVVMTLFEMVVGLGLALTGLVNPGPGGLNASGFNPGTITNSSAFYLAVVFSIFAFTGFESAAAVGEESRDPRKIIPLAIMGSVALIGIFYVVTAWGLQIGWGTDKLSTLASSPTAPAFVLADRLWNGASLIVLVALINSGLGVCIACTTSSTRTIYGMSRTGALPKSLSSVNGRFGTPSTALYVQTATAVLVCMVFGLWLGPFDLFNVLGTTGTFVYIPIFIMMNIAAYRFFSREKRDEFSIFAHVFCPILSSLALLTIGYKSLDPLPAMPVKVAPLVALGYLVVGLIVLFGRNTGAGKQDWEKHAGEVPAP